MHLAVRDLASAMAILFIIFSSVFMEYRGRVNSYSLAGSLTVILAAVVSDQGRGFLGVKNVDLFHYLLAIAMFLLAEGLLA